MNNFLNRKSNPLNVKNSTAFLANEYIYLLKKLVLISTILFFSENFCLISQVDSVSLKFDSLQSEIPDSINIKTTGANSKITIDTAQIYRKEFSQSKFADITKDKEFDYSRKPRPDFDLWNLIERLFYEFILKPLAKILDNSSPQMTLAYILIFISIIAIYIFMRKKINMRIDSSIGNSLINSKNILDSIHSIDFEKEILLNENSGNYSEAVRYKYLKILKEMFDSGVLHYKISNTNSDYLKEIRNTSFFEKFRVLSDIFNYVSYGKFILSKEEYLTISEIYSDFSNMRFQNEKS